MKNFRTLELAVEFHLAAEQLKLKGHMKDQLFRAATSISLNLSEGNAKRTVPEKKRFYQMSYASAQECKTILKLAEVSDCDVVDMLDKLNAWIYNLSKSEISSQDFN